MKCLPTKKLRGILKMINSESVEAEFDKLLEYFNHLKITDGDSIDLQLAVHYLKKCKNHILKALYFGGRYDKEL